tara:strand:- start:499 stop:660 length:162 start_codon:yes stop_codon:yes gene_type:complete
VAYVAPVLVAASFLASGIAVNDLKIDDLDNIANDIPDGPDSPQDQHNNLDGGG